MRKWRYIAALILLCFSFAVTAQAEAMEVQEHEAAERMDRAKELGLEEWVDQEGYLVDAFFEGKSDAQLSEMSLDGLIRTMTEEEVAAFVERLRAGISLYTVTKYQKVSQLNPDTGRYLYSGLFEVDGILAFCIEREMSTPAKGSETGPWIAVENEDVRKVLYHGYNGPADKGYTLVETALAAAEANGHGDNSLGRRVLAEIQLLESPPEDFLVWKVETNGGSTQELAFYTYEVEEEKISLELLKYGGDISVGLSGAKFKHVSPDGTEEIAVTDENGKIIWEDLQKGIHLIEEVEAPDGYLRNRNVISILVTEENELVLDSEIEMEFGSVILEENQLKVENKIGYHLPNTGSHAELLLNMSGFGGIILSITCKKRRTV